MHTHICQHCKREYICNEQASPEGDTDTYCGWFKFVGCNECLQKVQKGLLIEEKLKQQKNFIKYYLMKQ